MDPLFMALSCYRRRKYEKCVELCSELLTKNPYDQGAWTLKTRALTAQVWVDEVECDEQGVAEMLMDDNSIAQVSRPGTSLKAPPSTGKGAPTQGIRPMTQSGRPLSGFVRPGTQGGGASKGGLEQTLRTARTAATARPVSAASGRHIRLGTASMLTSPDGPFINLARLNLNKYAARPAIAKSLFDYIFHHENDVRTALALAALATEACQFKDSWWKVQLGKCYYRLSMYRDAERQYQSALQQQETLDAYLHLAKVYSRLDQPLTALETYNRGLKTFPKDASLQTGIARIHEALGDNEKAAKVYRDVLHQDNMSVEAIACQGTYHFYADQPELALKYYRRLLAMGITNAPLYNNIGLCCFYAQQYDMSLTCFENALRTVSDDAEQADIWFNISHIALSVGDSSLATQCLHIALAVQNEHAEAYNNLGCIEARKGHVEQARAFYQASAQSASHLYEPHYNFAQLCEQVGDLQGSFNEAKVAVDLFPGHADSKELLERLRSHFSIL